MRALLKKKIPKQWLVRLQERLRAGPFLNSNVKSLVRLRECFSLGDRALGLEQMRQIALAFLENPILRGQNRAMILNQLMFLAIDGSDPHQALDFARRAARANRSDVQHQLNLVALLAALGRAEEARQALAQIPNPDRLLRLYRQRYERLRDKLEGSREN